MTTNVTLTKIPAFEHAQRDAMCLFGVKLAFAFAALESHIDFAVAHTAAVLLIRADPFPTSSTVPEMAFRDHRVGNQSVFHRCVLKRHYANFISARKVWTEEMLHSNTLL